MGKLYVSFCFDNLFYNNVGVKHKVDNYIRYYTNFPLALGVAQALESWLLDTLTLVCLLLPHYVSNYEKLQKFTS